MTTDTYSESTHFGKVVYLPDSRGGRIGNCWKKGRFYEHGLLKHVFHLGLQGTYVDVGMNVGNRSLFFARVCPSRRMLSFEPFVKHIVRAEGLFERNEVRGKINIFNVALAESAGEVDIRIRSWATRALKMRLDSVAPADVTLMKIDVEGLELAAIRGAAQTITSCIPHLFVELWQEKFEQGVEKITALEYRLGRKFKTPTYEFIPV